MSKLLYLNIKTVNVNTMGNGIHQLGGLIEIDGKVVDKFKFNVKPSDDVFISEKALENDNITREDLEEYPDIKDVYEQLNNILMKYVDKFDKKDKFHLVSYYNIFVCNQLRAFFKEAGDDYFGSWFHSNSIDIMSIAGEFLIDIRKELPNFKLKTVIETLIQLELFKEDFVLNESKLNNSLYNIILIREVHKAIKLGRFKLNE